MYMCFVFCSMPKKNRVNESPKLCTVPTLTKISTQNNYVVDLVSIYVSLVLGVCIKDQQ